MKKTTLILIGIAIFIGALIVYTNHASAYSGITYNRGASASWYGVITWWGEVNNSAFYTADQAGELFLYQATKTANDSAVVALNINLRPTDEYVMGGQKEDLWLNVSTMTYTSVNISLNGTSINGSYLNETIYVTGPGNYSFTNLFRTATGCYVRNAMGATGSLRMNITQGKWGVVWKLGNSTNMNSYMYFCGFACNGSSTEQSYWNETNGTMNFMPNYATTAMTLNNFVNFNWGQNNSNGNPVYGCNIDFGGYSSAAISFFSASTSAGGGRLSFYDCNFHGFRSGSGSSAFVLNNYNLTMVGCTMDRGFGITSANNTYMYRCNIGGSSQSIIGGFTNPVFIGDLLLTDATGRAIYITGTNGFDASNITTKNCTILVRCFDLQSNVVRYLRNSKVNTLYMTWAGTPVGTPKFYIVYGLFGRVMQINTTNGIPYANISVYESINGGAWTPTWVLNTGANGYIPYTWMNRSNYTLNDAYPGNTTLRFVVQREGFQTLNFTMMINQESNESWIMRPNSTITILESLANATGTNVTSFDGTNYTIWNNYTGYSINLTVLENLVTCVGTNESGYDSGFGWYVYNNYTGSGTVATPSNLTISLPYPANGTTVATSSSGINVSVNVSFANFTDPPANLPTTVILFDDADDGNLAFADADYETCRQRDTVFVKSTTQTFALIGQFFDTSYHIYRSAFYFNTSEIPDGAIITNVLLRFATSSKPTTITNFSIVVQHNETDDRPTKPLDLSDYNYTYYSGDGGSINSTDIDQPVLGTNSYFNITLNSDGISWINKTGFTKLMLRGSSDIYDITPTDNEYLGVRAYENASIGMPRLYITYQEPTFSWSNVVNLTFYSNSSGSWLPFSYQQITSNGTYFAQNDNFTEENTTYYWMVTGLSTDDNESVMYHFFTFSCPHISNLTVGIASGLILGIPIGINIIRKKRRNQNA